jgi:hypothetical protein
MTQPTATGRRFLNALIGIFLFCNGLCTAAPAPAAEMDSQELLEYLIRQNEAARAKIRSFSCTLDITQSGRTRTAQLKQQGSCLWLVSNQPARTGPVAGHQTRMVVNDRYMAEYTLPIPRSVMSYGNWFDYDSFDTMDNETKRRIQTNTPDDFFAHCFGNRSESFRWSMTRRPDIRWDAVQTTDTDGRTVYQIRRFASRSNLPYSDAVWVVDPDKGFLATEIRSNIGDKSWHYSMQVEQVTPGVWFPIAFQQENYRQGFKPRQSLDNWKRVSVRDLQVNTDIPPEQFEFDALNLWEDAPDVIVLRFQTDGTKIPYVYDDTGQLIPQRERDRQNAARPSDLNSTDEIIRDIIGSDMKEVRNVKYDSYVNWGRRTFIEFEVRKEDVVRFLKNTNLPNYSELRHANSQQGSGRMEYLQMQGKLYQEQRGEKADWWEIVSTDKTLCGQKSCIQYDATSVNVICINEINDGWLKVNLIHKTEFD